MRKRSKARLSLVFLFLLGILSPVHAQAVPVAVREMDAVAADSLLKLLVRSERPGALDSAGAIYVSLLAGQPEDEKGAAVVGRLRAQFGLISGRGIADPALWWRRHDPVPATLTNERLNEHLARVLYAEAEFPETGRPTALDDRGETYVRFGAPTRRTEIDFNDGPVLREIIRFGSNVVVSEFPKNEVWTYPAVDYTGLYIFILNDEGAYRVGTTADLIPSRIRNGGTSAMRDRGQALTLLAVLRHIYGRLSVLHADFAARFIEVEQYMLWQEEQATSAELGAEPIMGTRIRRAGVGGTNARVIFENSMVGVDPVEIFVSRRLAQSDAEDLEAVQRREVNMPVSFADVESEMAPKALDVAVRYARFRDADGTTRTEVYWGLPPGALSPSKRRQRELNRSGFGGGVQVIKASAVQYDDQFRRNLIDMRNMAVTNVTTSGGEVIPGQTLQLAGSDGPYEVALQLQTFAARLRESAAETGPPLGFAVRRSDRLVALSADPAVLEMSDLRPFLIAPTEAPPSVTEARRRAPHPYAELAPSALLGLYFEAYGLVFGADDKTRYRVDYEVMGVDRETGLARLLRRDRRSRTATSASYSGEERSASEYMVLDLSEWDQADRVQIKLRLTDETSGKGVERNIAFDILPQ